MLSQYNVRFGSGLRSLFLPVADDFLWLAVVEFCELGAGPGMRTQQLVEFRLDSLRISIFGSSDEESHQPCCERRSTVPIEGVPLKDEPENSVSGDDGERGRMCGEFAQAGQ